MITPRTTGYLWFRMGSQGYRLQEPVSIPHELPHFLKEIVDLHRSDLGYSVEGLAKLMICTEEEVRNDLFQANSGLRVVG